MSEPTTSNLIEIPVNSSISSGVSALIFDIVLIAVIRAELQLLCSIANVYLLYDKRDAISPSQSRIGFLTGGPVGPLQLSRIFSVLLTLVTACVVVLGFSINGKTVQTYNPVVFSSVVQITGRPLQIDFGKEFRLVQKSQGGNDTSPLSRLVSKRLLAVSDSFACMRSNYTHTRLYAYAYRDRSLGYEMESEGSKVLGAQCIENPLFKNPIVSRQYLKSAPGDPIDCTASNISDINFEEGKQHGKAVIFTERCDLKQDELYCFKTDRIACAGMWRQYKTRNVYIYLIPNITQVWVNEIVHVAPARRRHEKRLIALNVAFFSAAGFRGGVSNLANMAISNVTQNRSLEYQFGPMNVSEIDMRIAIPLVGFVVGVSVLLLIIAVILWLLIVYSRGRHNYNTFSTFHEILQGASCSGSYKYRRPQKEDPCIGIARDIPRIVVVGPKERQYCTQAIWREEEIDLTGNCNVEQ